MQHHRTVLLPFISEERRRELWRTSWLRERKILSIAFLWLVTVWMVVACGCFMLRSRRTISATTLSPGYKLDARSSQSLRSVYTLIVPEFMTWSPTSISPLNFIHESVLIAKSNLPYTAQLWPTMERAAGSRPFRFLFLTFSSSSCAWSADGSLRSSEYEPHCHGGLAKPGAGEITISSPCQRIGAERAWCSMLLLTCARHSTFITAKQMA